MVQAGRLAEELSQKYPGQVTLTDGVGGQLDVIVDGRVVYSKQQLGRYTFDEAVRAVETAKPS